MYLNNGGWKDRIEWRALVNMCLNEFHAAIFSWTCVLSDCPPVLWWFTPGDGWDAVSWCGWDKLWKERNNWILWLTYQLYGLRAVCWCLCVCYIWLDMIIPWATWWREKVKVYYFYNIKFIYIYIYIYTYYINGSYSSNVSLLDKILFWNPFETIRTLIIKDRSSF